MQLHTLVALVALSATPILAYPAPQSFNARASDDGLAFLSTRGAGQSTLGGPQCGPPSNFSHSLIHDVDVLQMQRQRAGWCDRGRMRWLVRVTATRAESNYLDGIPTSRFIETQCAVPQSGSKKVGTCFGGGSGWPAMNEVWKVHDYGGLYVLKLANGSIRKIGSKERVGTKPRTHLDGWSGLRSMHG